MRLKRDSLDALFSNYIRLRDGYNCQRCGAHHDPPTQAIHCAHIFSRGNKGLRWDEDNAIALCYGCHRYYTAYPLYFRAWVKQRIGAANFDLLMFRARRPTKFTKGDREMIRQLLKAKLEALKVSRVTSSQVKREVA